jgi:hypothetical protein
MPRSFDILTESPASVEQIHAAFGNENYWRARIAATHAATTLDSLIVEADGTVTARVTQHLGRQLLPGLVAKLIPGDLKILHCETWRPVGDRQVRGQVNVSAAGGLGSGRAEVRLAPASNGSQLRFAVRVEVKIPLVGGKLEKSEPVWLRASPRGNASPPSGSPKMLDSDCTDHLRQADGQRLDSNADGRRGAGAHPDRFAHDLDHVEPAQQGSVIAGYRSGMDRRTPSYPGSRRAKTTRRDQRATADRRVRHRGSQCGRSRSPGSTTAGSPRWHLASIHR